MKTFKLREFSEDSRSGAGAASFLVPKVHAPKMASQFPNDELDEEEDDEDDYYKNLLEKVVNASEEKIKQSKVEQ